MTSFNVLSPDGFHIRMDEEYESRKDAKSALKGFIDRYRPQGYYSSAEHGRIPVDMIICFCRLQVIENGRVVDVEDLD